MIDDHVWDRLLENPSSLYSAAPALQQLQVAPVGMKKGNQGAAWRSCYFYAESLTIFDSGRVQIQHVSSNLSVCRFEPPWSWYIWDESGIFKRQRCALHAPGTSLLDWTCQMFQTWHTQLLLKCSFQVAARPVALISRFAASLAVSAVRPSVQLKEICSAKTNISLAKK